jgi:phospholipid N-methyltransferase
MRMADRSRDMFLKEHLMVMSRFVRNPRGVGAIAPSSRSLAEAMVAGLDFSRPLRVAELGPGMGAFTALLHDRLRPGSRLIVVEIDDVFVGELRRRWPLMEVEHGPAERLPQILKARALESVDHIISGLPFVSLPGPVVDRTLQAVARCLPPGGTFTTFQYAHAYNWPPATASRALMARYLQASQPRTRIVIRNLPPAIVLCWTRG